MSQGFPQNSSKTSWPKLAVSTPTPTATNGHPSGPAWGQALSIPPPGFPGSVSSSLAPHLPRRGCLAACLLTSLLPNLFLSSPGSQHPEEDFQSAWPCLSLYVLPCLPSALPLALPAPVLLGQPQKVREVNEERVIAKDRPSSGGQGTMQGRTRIQVREWPWHLVAAVDVQRASWHAAE